MLKTDLYELNIVIKNKNLEKYYNKGKTYIEGRKGSEFSIELKNNSSKKVLMIPSVDGLSVIEGTPASENSKGYLVAAHSKVVIPGWSLNDDAVAKFTFSDKKESYAANHQDHASDLNQGVIGCIAWSEKETKKVDWSFHYNPPPYIPTFWKSPYDYNKQPFNGEPYFGSGVGIGNSGGIMRSSMVNAVNNVATSYSVTLGSSTNSTDTISATACSFEQPKFELGTEFGKETEFKVQTATFDKDKVVETLVVYYDSKKGLEKRGIVFAKPIVEKQEPNPFPASVGCKPPLGYKQA